GLGVFAGDWIGTGDAVRRISVQALREVLEEISQEKLKKNQWENFSLVIFSMPVFKKVGKDNFHWFVEGFKGYEGVIPVWIVDNDMHAIARLAAKQGLKVAELNPADSHGVFGEYWQNR